MNDITTITFRLDTYLLQLSKIGDRWSTWLQNNEKALTSRSEEQLDVLQAQAKVLNEDLSAIIADRTRLLEDAATLNLHAPNLRTLARALPAWKQRQSLRAALSRAERQIEFLRRLHYSCWVLLHSQIQFYRDSLSLMMSGSSRRDVYTNTDRGDMSGGHLLDANL